MSRREHGLIHKANMYQVILYYKFYPIKDRDGFLKEHQTFCREHNLKGRVYISSEGINGTLAGFVEDIVLYKNFLCSKPGFKDTEFKEDKSDDLPFARLKVKLRPEIVTLKSDVPVDPSRESAPRISPQEWRETLESQDDFLLIDVRNNYESRIGHFEGAVTPDVANFYDFPQWLASSHIDKNKKILMYCTGGIRCEKFSLYMLKKGYKNISQLQGGIINYAQKEGGARFKGKCFVFDDRLVVGVQPDSVEPISRCDITGIPCDSYLNCANIDCNKLFICSAEGARRMEGSCSEACQKSSRRKPFHPDKIYEPTPRLHTYFKKDNPSPH